MAFWDFLNKLFHAEAEHKLRVSIGPDRCDRAYDETEVRAGEHYVRVVLAQMFLHDRRVFLSEYRPAVHSLVKLTMGKEAVEIPNVADSSKIALREVGNAAVIANNYSLTPPLPFNGGDFAIDAGLVSVRVANTLEHYLGTLSKFAGLLNVTQISSVLKFAEPLALGIQNLFSDGGGRMHLGFHNAYTARAGDGQLANPLRQGYIALVDATTGDLDPNRLFVIEDNLHTGRSLNAGDHEPITGFDYMLLRIEVFTERDDWRNLTAIEEPFAQALSVLTDPNFLDPNRAPELLGRAMLSLRQAQMRANQAPELTIAHRRIVVKKLQEFFNEAKDNGGIPLGLTDSTASAGSAERGGGPLHRIMSTVRPETIRREAGRRSYSDEEIFAMG